MFHKAALLFYTMPKQYKHIFFDLDHTLWDFDKNSGIVLEQLYQDFDLQSKGVARFEDFYNIYSDINESLWEKFRKGDINRNELRVKRFSRTLLEFKIGDESLSNNLSRTYLELLPVQTQLTPFAIEVLDYCNSKYLLHLITNGFDTTQRMKLNNSGISKYFSEVITSEKSMSMKPQIEIFTYALNKTGASPENAIMIGDHLEVDIVGAKDAGWDQIYYNPLKKTHNRQPTHEISSLKEVMEIL